MKLTINKKIILICLSITILETFILGAISYHSLKELIQVNSQLEEISQSLDTTNLLSRTINQTIVPISNYLMTGNPKERLRFQELRDILRKNLALCHNTQCHTTLKQPIEMAKAIQPVIDEVEERSRTIFALTYPLQTDSTEVLIKDIGELTSRLDILLGKMSAALLIRVEELREKSQKITHKTLSYFLISIGALVPLVILVSYASSIRLTKPISQLYLGMQRVANNDLDYQIDIKARDEIGDLTDSFNHMIKKLKIYREAQDQHRKRLEQEIKEKTEELQQAEAFLIQSDKLASIGLLASGMAHELNNPLTSILMNVNLLMEITDKDTELYKELQKIDEDGSRCKKIVEDLLSFSRQNRELRRDTIGMSRFDLNKSLEKALSLIQPEVIRRDIKIKLDLNSEILLCSGDEKYIQQVFINIILNAIQAIGKGGTIEITTSFSQLNKCAEILIRDNGPGIPREYRDRIFDPFFTTKPQGTGLGLFICYGIIRQYGGTIKIESLTQEELSPDRGEVTTGTMVKLTLPVVKKRVSS